MMGKIYLIAAVSISLAKNKRGKMGENENSIMASEPF
jgi:hypothetical protein